MEKLDALVEKLKKYGYDVHTFENAQQAKNYLLETIPQTDTVGIGGSMTVQQMGLDQALRARGQQVFWHWGVPAEEANEMRKKAATADTYLCSANALTMDGKIVNIDGFGNRLAATLHGTGKVYMIVGKNKLAENLDAAIARIKNVSCPANAKRLGLKTPCAVLGHCTDCSSPQRMCTPSISCWWMRSWASDFEYRQNQGGIPWPIGSGFRMILKLICAARWKCAVRSTA